MRGLGLRSLGGWSLRKTGAYRALVVFRDPDPGNQAARGGPGNQRLPLTLLSRLPITAASRTEWFRSSRGRKIRRQHGECRRDDKVVMAASCLQPKLASRARLEDELGKLPAQEVAGTSPVPGTGSGKSPR